MANTMHFVDAYTQAKSGKRIRRATWPVKYLDVTGTQLYECTPPTFAQTEAAKPNPGATTRVLWTPTQADVTAADWWVLP